VTNEEFSVPSVLRDVRDWDPPSLADSAGDLLDHVGVGAAKDPIDGLGEYLASLLDALEPTLILLSVCGYSASRLVVAGADTPVAVSLPFDSRMQVTGWDRADWSPAILHELIGVPALVGLEVSSPFLGVPLTRLQEGWFLIPVNGAAPALDLANLLGELGGGLATAEEELKAAVGAVVGTADLAGLAGEPALPSGYLTMFDPAGWSIAVLDGESDAVAAGDPDAVALAELGEATRMLIDDAGIEAFLAEEIERDQETRMPLRDRFRESRDARQLLRRAMRGARRRHRTLDPDGIHRAFRFGRSRRLTYTEFLIGCHAEGVVDVLDRIRQRTLTSRWEFDGDVHGEPGQLYLIARRPPPHQAMQPFELVLINPPAAPGELVISYRRWGHEHGVAGVVDPSQLSLSTGRVALPLLVVDGAQETPTLEVKRYGLDGSSDPLEDEIFGDTGTTEVLQISGVQHGDVLVLADSASGTTAELAIVKNFTGHDLNRLLSAGFALGVAAPFGDPGALAETLIDTITFALADGPGTPQEVQRTDWSGVVTGPFPPTDTPRAAPAALDIPSARGIGILPDDASYLYLCGPAGGLTNQLETRAADLTASASTALDSIAIPEDLPVHADESFRGAIAAHHEATGNELADLIDDFAGTAGATTMWHTYGMGEATLPNYLLAGNDLQLWPGDPLRNILTDRDRAPALFAVNDLADASSGIEEQALEALLRVNVFVDRRAELVLYVEPVVDGGEFTNDPAYGATLQVADALASLADGGQTPTNVAQEPEEPKQPTTPRTGLGSVTLRVVDDAGDPLARAIVTITGETTQSVKSGLDGALALTRQKPGSYQAFASDYPGHEPGTVEFEIRADRSVDVELVLDRIPPPPELPPLRGAITEASGFFVREAPGGEEQILGKLDYTAYDVTVLEAREIPKYGPPVDDLWFRVRFAPRDFERVVTEYEAVLIAGELDPATEDEPSGLEKIELHTAAIAAHQGTEAWIGQAAFAVVATPWDHFLDLLADFELEHAGDDVLTRLSRLRQMGENADVSANDAAGSGDDVEDPINRSERPHDPDRWSLLFESKQVELPDGEVIDIHHFLLGVEGLIDDGRRSEDRTVQASYGPLWVNLRIGESYSALTWSGDIGAAVGDMVRHESADWEAAKPRQPDEILEFYLRTRAPEFDLLPDIDAWGAYELMPHRDGTAPGSPTATSLTELVTWVYGPPGPWTPEHDESRAGFRANGIRELLTHYGFTDASGLLMQVAAGERMEEQVRIFSPTWFTMQALKALLKKVPKGDVSEGSPWPNAAEEAELELTSGQMTPLFLDWLARLAEQHDVDLTAPPP